MNWYFSYRRSVDYALAIIATCLVYFQPLGTTALFAWPNQEVFGSFVLSVSASGASLLGFVLAANTFLISHTQHRRLTLLRRSNGYNQLLQVMRSNLWRLLTLTLYTGIGSLVTPRFIEFMLTGLTFIAVLSLTAFAALIWSTMAILAIPLD